ncbi:MAG: nucleotide exchange factor GrpE [Mariprofundaceae bacterium]|nr:nucleotide exchange factor GrpE [Mariprofundaceae bacterium]
MNEKHEEQAHKEHTEADLEMDKQGAEIEAPDSGEGIDVSEEASEENTAADELEAAYAEIAELKDKLLRNHAEMDNLRKRTQREVADAHKFGIEKFTVALLDVVDNLERALEVGVGNEEALRDGVKLTLDSWHKMMEKFNLERIDAVGETFDPHQHEALSQMPHNEPAGTVVAQHVAGYKLHGRLLRPAKVLISTGQAEAEK